MKKRVGDQIKAAADGGDGAAASEGSASGAVVGGETAATAAASECTIIGEIGINHNGDMDLCKKLIMASKVAGGEHASSDLS